MPLAQPALLSTRSTNGSACLWRFAKSCLAAVGLVLLFCGAAHAQGGVPFVTVATDQSPLPVPNQYSIPMLAVVNQNSDFAFIGGGSSGLFFRASGATSSTLLLQLGDPIPGLPGSLITSFSPILAMNSSRSITFGVNYSLPDGLPRAAVLVYSGSAFSIVANSDSIAPGSGGANYGTTLLPGSIDDSGDISFTATPTGQSSTTFFIVPSGGTAVRVAGMGDSPPAACTWCTTNLVDAGFGVSYPSAVSYIQPLNALGQMPFLLAGGIFIASKGGLELVTLPSSGPCSPSFSTNSVPLSSLPLLANGILLNDAGILAYTNATSTTSAICVSTSGGPATAVVASGQAAPVAIGGTFASFTTAGLDDSGDILFTSQISGGSTTYALMRYHSSSVPAGQIDIVAYNGEVLPDGSTFASPSFTEHTTPPTIIPLPAFNGISMSSTGLVSFNVSLSPSGVAIYQQAGQGVPVRVALSGQTALSSGEGTLLITETFTQTLNDGATYFLSSVTSASTSFGEFLGTPAGIQTLFNTADSVPSNSRISLSAVPPVAAANHVAFLAQLPGAGHTLFVSDTSSGVISKVASDADFAIPVFTILSFGSQAVGSNFFVNEAGQVAFAVLPARVTISIGSNQIVFAGFPPCGKIFLWSATAGSTQVATSGQAGPVAGTTLCPALNSGQLSPLNDSGQITFFSTVQFPASSSSSNEPSIGFGILEYTPGGGISELVETHGSLPGTTAPVGNVSFIPDPINSFGEVALSATAGTGSNSAGFLQGFFLDAPGGNPSAVFETGETVPGTNNTFQGPNSISGLDDNGDVAFTATTSGAADGLFLAPPGKSIQTLALDGGAAPGGGTFSLLMPFSFEGTTFKQTIDFALMNNESDVAFRAGITGGAGDSGYFRVAKNGANAGVVQIIALQGETLPSGTAGSAILNTIPAPGNQGANFALGPDGSLAFVNGITAASTAMQGMFVVQPNGTIVKVLASGDPAPGGGTVNELAMSQGVAGGGTGQFAFWSGIQGGTARQAIFATAIPPGTAGTNTAVGYSRSSVVFGATITLSALVSSTAAGIPTGTISFFDGGVLLGTAAVNSGQTTLNISTLATGTHSIAAQYSGDVNFASSTSTGEELGISVRTTSTALASSLNPAVGGQSVTLTATVTTTAGGSATGTVTFLDGATSIGTGTLNGSGVATLSTTSLSVASHSITASYGGDVNSGTSVSAAMTENVVIAAIVPPSMPLSVVAGQSINIPLTLMGAPGSNLSFPLSCSGLPAASSCSFAPNPASAGPPPNGTSVQLTFSTTAGSGSATSGLPGTQLILRGLSGLGIGSLLSALFAASALVCRRAPRWRLAGFACLATLTLALLIAGCGSSGGPSPSVTGTPPGPATFTITGTSGATTISTTVTVTVH
jgi:hypothetical protein